MKKFLDNRTVAALLCIIVGVLFCIFKARILNWILTAVGVVFVAYAIYFLVQKNYTNAVILGVVGVLLILGGWLFIKVAMTIIGIIMAVAGICSLFPAVRAKDVKSVVVSAATAVIGIMLIVSGWTVADWAFIVSGIILIADGFLSLVSQK